MNTVDLSAIKNKFGALLSFAVLQCQIKEDVVSSKIARHPFFDFLENNDTRSFLNTPNDSLCLTVLGADVRNETTGFRNDVRYIGEAYISASVCLSIPLRKLFLLYPLEELLTLYPAYHEMGPFRIVEKVHAELQKRSAFSVFLRESGLNILQLSRLCGCDRRTLKAIETNPETEAKLNYGLLTSLCELLQADPVFFKSSAFVPYSLYLWDNPEFVGVFQEKLTEVVGSRYPVLVKSMGKDEGIGSHVHVSYRGVEIVNVRGTSQIPTHLFNYLVKTSIEEFKRRCFEKQTAFC